MTVSEVLAAWKAAQAAGGAAFYSTFESLTGFTEADVKRHFAAWNNLTHEAAEEVAAENGVSVREAGFQAYLADVKRIGRPRIAAIVGQRDEDETDPNPRQTKPWPEAEDCPGCDLRAGAENRHRFGCTIHGGRRRRVPVTQDADGTFRVDGRIIDWTE
jgi:hypothetical protein